MLSRVSNLTSSIMNLFIKKLRYSDPDFSIKLLFQTTVLHVIMCIAVILITLKLFPYSYGKQRR